MVSPPSDRQTLSDDKLDQQKSSSGTIEQGKPTDNEMAESNTMQIELNHRNKHHTVVLPLSASVQNLSEYIDQHLSIPISHQKLLISPKPGMLKPPFPDTPLSSIMTPHVGRRAKITLLGSTPTEISDLNANIALANRRNHRDFSTAPAKPVTPYRRAPSVQDLQSSTTYTFLQLRPLPYLPRPERSLAFLERLRADPGIKASMAKHKWSVPLLTEMDPAAHTTHESRTLGLNRNKGEVIELRLRTDAYDGYRDYKTIRNTLCHELAHNVHGEHDRDFWDLCHQIEKEVAAADWKSGGHRLTNDEIREPTPSVVGSEGMVADHGGWSGGEFVLGGGPPRASSSTAIGASGSTLSRRDILANAVEERIRKQKHKQHQEEGSQPGEGANS